ncbi:hypothetical protein F4780DRAFT_662146 [Xylariomycetidae sp. FL0641]|nr:hypothetical protein F4780DRAFT_662146 [Xylariomycetidae sp. FL0641]
MGSGDHARIPGHGSAFSTLLASWLAGWPVLAAVSIFDRPGGLRRSFPRSCPPREFSEILAGALPWGTLGGVMSPAQIRVTWGSWKLKNQTTGQSVFKVCARPSPHRIARSTEEEVRQLARRPSPSTRHPWAVGRDHCRRRSHCFQNLLPPSHRRDHTQRSRRKLLPALASRGDLVRRDLRASRFITDPAFLLHIGRVNYVCTTGWMDGWMKERQSTSMYSTRLPEWTTSPRTGSSYCTYLLVAGRYRT